MGYAVKEIFYTLQGEGAQAGRPAVFCRFAGCNLWSGREEDRSEAICQFCDTDFVGINGTGGGRFAADALAKRIVSVWPEKRGAAPFVVLTGGEPLLQVDRALLAELHRFDCTVAIETNGTIRAPSGLDWICVSPKADAELVQKSGDEIKLIFPQRNLDPAAFLDLSFKHFFLQPKDGPDRAVNTQLCLRYCLEHPRWRLSVQTHKTLGIP
jgi:7-carboxy-7-deazaguanine synthase (Cx14CxxC type)